MAGLSETFETGPLRPHRVKGVLTIPEGALNARASSSRMV